MATKKELREKLFAEYRKAYKTSKKPDELELSRFVNILAKAIECCHDAEEKLGTDLFRLVKRCTKVHKRSVDVLTTRLCDEIGYYEDDEQIRKS